MSTELRNVPTTELSQTRFFGGELRGVCVQITQRKPEALTEFADKFFNKIQLTRLEARELSIELMMFANGKEVEEENSNLISEIL
jgi:hypothetical protein